MGLTSFLGRVRRIGGIGFFLITTPFAYAFAASPPVSLVADSILYDDLAKKITAEGGVDITQASQSVRADKVVYHVADDRVEAIGHVVLRDERGNTHYAERMELQTQFKDGTIQSLKSLLSDGSRLAADEGIKKGGVTTMKHARYTACEECKSNPEKPVLWEITADEVTHDSQQQSIDYKNATLNILDVPVFYTPYFSHSDGTVDQKSGFLSPRLSLNSRLGLGITNNYYWAISPSEDATIGVRAFTKNSPQLLTAYRKRFDSAMIDMESSATYSDTRNEFRGHLFGKGLWNINDEWRAGFTNELVSDDTYVNEYDINAEDVLQNQIYAERFDDRDYFVARAVSFQDIRVSNRSTDQPNILPEFQASFYGDPNATLGGRWMVDISSLNLMRSGNGQDVFRVSGLTAWQRRDSLSSGLVNTLSVETRGDVYKIADRDETSLVGGAGGAYAYRFYPSLHNVTAYPLAKSWDDNTQAVIEPTLSFTLAPIVKNDTNIPNEDSQDVQIDNLNLFDANRFPGLDRAEDGMRMTYGVRAGLYDDDQRRHEIFLGQSFRVNNNDNPFPDGSGLSQQQSDFVGQILTDYNDLYGLDYRFQLNAETLQPVRHEINGYWDNDGLKLSGTYFYSRRLAGTDLLDSRQQIYGLATYDLSDEWRLTSGARYDLTEGSQGLRFSELGLEYLGQCFTIATQARRKFTDQETGDNATELTIQLGLKNLGSFDSSKQ